ncbi:helicase associated domain-containing protein [Streptomyces sp. NPDC046931]|uniref:helicase associated domain-containing protein n=1 Tax=Streptomyces sp. NPDC046931 TaxID=3154806 RepID=UPI0033F9E4A9
MCSPHLTPKKCQRVGTWDGLGKDPEWAATRAQQLAAIDEDWNCLWPLDWQRHYRILADLAADEPHGHLPDIAPGVLMDGDDLGRWIQRQANAWSELSEEQQRRLPALGMTPAERPTPASSKGAANAAGRPSAAFHRGLAALAQYIAREGHHRVPRTHTEEIAVEGHNHGHRLGIWYSNLRSRRDKLTEPQRAALTELGVDWA